MKPVKGWLLIDREGTPVTKYDGFCLYSNRNDARDNRLESEKIERVVILSESEYNAMRRDLASRLDYIKRLEAQLEDEGL